MTEAERRNDREPVVVVGAGPIGMTAALALARHRVPSIVLEAEQGPSGEGSKAICVQRDVLDMLERLGCGTRMASEGVSWTLGRTYFRDQELFQTHLPQPTSVFPPFINLPQCRTEEVLLDCLLTTEQVEVRWEHRVTGINQDDAGVRLEVETPAGSRTVSAAYVVACDGGRSTVRGLLELDFPGHSHADRFLIADIRADLPFPNERRFFFDPPFNPGRTVLIHPQPDRVWRIDWQVPPDTDVDEERRSGRLDERIRAIIGDTPYELVWLSSYRFHQRVVPRFRVGRVLLAGDAAHLMSPFGARGMNSGMQDAENAAWKLALVWSGQAPQRLLDTYHEERWAAARENVRVTDRTMRFMVPPGRLRKAARNAILRASVVSGIIRRLVNSGRLAEPFDYAASSIVLHPDPEPASGLRPGQLAPDATFQLLAADRGPVAQSGSPARLRPLVGPEFLILAWPADPASGVSFATAALTEAPVPVKVALVLSGEDLIRPDAGGVAGLLVLHDDMGSLTAQYPGSRSRWYLIRPDGHLAAGPLPPKADLVPQVLEHCTARAWLVSRATDAA